MGYDPLSMNQAELYMVDGAVPWRAVNQVIARAVGAGFLRSCESCGLHVLPLPLTWRAVDPVSFVQSRIALDWPCQLPCAVDRVISFLQARVLLLTTMYGNLVRRLNQENEASVMKNLLYLVGLGVLSFLALKLLNVALGYVVAVALVVALGYGVFYLLGGRM